MHRRNWPAFLAAAGSVLSLLLAVWPGAILSGGSQEAVRNPGWWWVAHASAGAIGICAVLMANRYTMLSRGLLAIAAVLLLSLFVTEGYHPRFLITILLPAGMLAIAAPLITPADVSTRL